MKTNHDLITRVFTNLSERMTKLEKSHKEMKTQLTQMQSFMELLVSLLLGDDA